ncbi:RNA polymerase sigma factor [Streptomyces sp. AC627_RSS907]|uniref:RNA polymerase sigma factor n=1 Tax=Streptomyces sp. AC627_RSS907 TaxID=2823684 RepID=UPI0020B766FC|nr:sigma factor [Streptomyces sp. AC627_RSS907]
MSTEAEAGYTEMYRAHYDDVLRFVRRRAHPMNVDDLVGETFLIAWRRRGEVPEHSRPCSAPRATSCSTPDAE